MKFVVGGVGVELTDCPGPYDPAWGDELAFVGETGATDIELCVSEVAEITLPVGASMAFDGRPLWSMYRVGDGYWLVLWPESSRTLNAPVEAAEPLGRVLSAHRDGEAVDLSRAVADPLACLGIATRPGPTGHPSLGAAARETGVRCVCRRAQGRARLA